MKKLDDLPKKNIFEVPNGYFDRLPLKIQARIETGKETHVPAIWNVAVRYALPVIILGFGLLYYLKPSPSQTEQLLAEVSNEHLIAYLTESEISENDLMEAVNFDEADADSLTQHLSGTLLGEFDPDSYRDEFKRELESEL